MRSNKKKTTLIIGLIFALVLMAAGYSALSTTLNIESRNIITANCDVHIDSSATVVTTGGTGDSRGFNVSSDGLSASFVVDLYDDGDYVEYDITIVNAGNIPAKLQSVQSNVQNESNFIELYSNAAINTVIAAGGSYTFKARVYVNNPNQLPLEDSIGTVYTLYFNFVQYVNS